MAPFDRRWRGRITTLPILQRLKGYRPSPAFRGRHWLRGVLPTPGAGKLGVAKPALLIPGLGATRPDSAPEKGRRGWDGRRLMLQQIRAGLPRHECAPL